MFSIDTIGCNASCHDRTIQGFLDKELVSKCLSDSGVWTDPSVAVTVCETCVRSNKTEYISDAGLDAAIVDCNKK